MSNPVKTIVKMDLSDALEWVIRAIENGKPKIAIEIIKDLQKQILDDGDSE